MGRVFAGAAVAVLAVAAAGPARAASYGPGDTGVVNLTSTPSESQGEEPLAVNPRNPQQLTAVANVFDLELPGAASPFIGGGGFQDTRVYSSQDGGRHWLAQKLDQGGLGRLTNPLPVEVGGSPELSDALNIVNTDADSVWDAHGNAYFESGDIHGLYHHGDEVETVWRSTDGGVTWGPHLGVTAVSATAEHNELDRPWLAADTSGGAHDGRLYTTFETSPFVDDPPQVYVKYSDDHGRSWSSTTRVDDGTYETQYNPRQRPVVGADGTLYVVYDRAPVTETPVTPQAGRIALVLARSADGGETFTRVVIDDDVHRTTDPDEATPNYSEMISAIAADPARAGRLAVAWPEAQGADNSRIMLRFTADGGSHWSPRIDVADDPSSAADQHDHVTLAFLPDGRLAVGWRDRRCCGGAFADSYQEWVRLVGIAAPGSAPVLSRVVELTDGPQTGQTGNGRGALQPDEFQGMTATRLGISATWSQLVGQVDNLMYRRVPLSAFDGPASGGPAWLAPELSRRRAASGRHRRARRSHRRRAPGRRATGRRSPRGSHSGRRPPSGGERSHRRRHGAAAPVRARFGRPSRRSGAGAAARTQR